MATISINLILGLFQECQKSGQFATCYLETRGSAVTATFSVRCDNGNGKEEVKPRRRIPPSRRRRNYERRKAWLEKKHGSEVPPNASEPVNKDSSPDESVEGVENCAERVEDHNPEDSEKGLVWKLGLYTTIGWYF